jgi:hypothetical protein
MKAWLLKELKWLAWAAFYIMWLEHRRRAADYRAAKRAGEEWRRTVSCSTPKSHYHRRRHDRPAPRH